MGVKVIGRMGNAGAGLSPGNKRGGQDSLLDILLAMRDELDAVKADNEALKERLDNSPDIADKTYQQNLPPVASQFKK